MQMDPDLILYLPIICVQQSSHNAQAELKHPKLFRRVALSRNSFLVVLFLVSYS